MMSRFDAQKRTEWLQRFEQFEASGQSVVRFCREAGVAPHTFYYWRKQLRGSEGGGGRSNRTLPDRQQSVGKKEAEGHSNRSVCFAWGSALRVTVPAECVDAIRCVLECVTVTEPGDKSSGSFQEVVVAR